MRSLQHATRKNNQGLAYILAVLLLTVLTALAAAFATTTSLHLRKSYNSRNSMEAQLAVENGMSYTLMVLKSLYLPGTTTQDNFLANLTEVLGDQFDGTANLGAQAVTDNGSAVIVPEITTPHGAFTCSLTSVSASRCRLQVTGTANDVLRRASIELMFVSKRPAVFDYGIASKGQISIHGNAQIVGVNDPSEASILSATASHDNAIILDGGVTVSGDLYAAGDSSYVSISGSPEIAGSTDPAVYAQNIHTGVDVPDFPTLDTAPLAALATNVVDATTDISTSGLVFNNIRIAAGTNPVFSSDVTINGIVYIEAPNIVQFAGQTTLNGIVVTEENDSPISDCKITFAGGVEVGGIEILPDTPEFADVKLQTGTFVVAPGFDVTFAGHFSAINGCIAADKLTFTGTAEGTVRGSVIGLKDMLTDIGGNVSVQVDRNDSGTRNAGFVDSLIMFVVPDTYTEHVGN